MSTGALDTSTEHAPANPAPARGLTTAVAAVLAAGAAALAIASFVTFWAAGGGHVAQTVAVAATTGCSVLAVASVAVSQRRARSRGPQGTAGTPPSDPAQAGAAEPEEVEVAGHTVPRSEVISFRADGWVALLILVAADGVAAGATISWASEQTWAGTGSAVAYCAAVLAAVSVLLAAAAGWLPAVPRWAVPAVAALAVAALAAAAVPLPGWAMLSVNQASHAGPGLAGGAPSIPASKAWTLSEPPDTTDIDVSQDRIFVLQQGNGESSRLTAYDPASATVAWTYSQPRMPGLYEDAILTVSSEAVALTLGGRTVFLDPADGHVNAVASCCQTMFTFPGTDPVYAMAGTTFVVTPVNNPGSAPRGVAAYSALTGRLLWRRRSVGNCPTPRVSAFGAGTPSLASDGDVVALGFGCGSTSRVELINSASPSADHIITLPGSPPEAPDAGFSSAPVSLLSVGRVLVASYGSGRMAGIAFDSGRILWSRSFPDWPPDSSFAPVAAPSAGGVVTAIGGVPGNKTAARWGLISTATGATEATYPQSTGTLLSSLEGGASAAYSAGLAAGGRLYLPAGTSRSPSAVTVDIRSGEQLSSLRLPSAPKATSWWLELAGPVLVYGIDTETSSFDLVHTLTGYR